MEERHIHGFFGHCSSGDAPLVLCFGCGVLKGGSWEDGLLADPLPSFVDWSSSFACIALKISFFLLMKRYWAVISQLTMAGGMLMAATSTYFSLYDGWIWTAILSHSVHNVIYFSNSELSPSSIALLACSAATYGWRSVASNFAITQMELRWTLVFKIHLKPSLPLYKLVYNRLQ